MNSEFYHVALDRIRYSLVWEDHQTLYHALDISPKDHVLIVTSAGCNVLNTLLKNPATVTAIDLNPVQNKLLLFKQHVILYHDYATFHGISGLDGKEQVAGAWKAVKETQPAEMQCYWASFFAAHPDGLLTSGKLEAYITGFYNELDRGIQQKLHQLMQFDDIEGQSNFFIRELHPSAFRDVFTDYFSDEKLSRGRDPKLYIYAEENGRESFYQRLFKKVSTVLLKDNFYVRFFFFGPCNLPQEILPPCYQQKNFELLKKQMHKLAVVTGEAVDFLLSPQGTTVTKASLSNIFEYTSHNEFEKVRRSLFRNNNRKLTIVLWNLLHEQGGSNFPHLNMKITGCETGKESCFYFKNVRLLQHATITSPDPHLNIL